MAVALFAHALGPALVVASTLGWRGGRDYVWYLHKICHIALMMLKPVISNPYAHELGSNMELVWPESEAYSSRVINCSHANSSLAAIQAKLSAEQLEQFKTSCFGHLLNIDKIQFSGQIVHGVVLHRVSLIPDEILKEELAPLSITIPNLLNTIDFYEEGVYANNCSRDWWCPWPTERVDVPQ
ncbi:hypothetical protein L3X38_017702 [Prunus dulcis]|uniref:Uncharacterized protein n=1 Tax=Prunus dulcis TaxID=3755 RepID=A0AAD4WA86_PRUDU|nr:hypothetical protein L3X38_017702 [Prunus dulcis]